MEIAVCFQIVPDLADAAAEDWPLSPEEWPKGAHKRFFDSYDESALEQGLRLREEIPDARLTAVTASVSDDKRQYETLFALGYERVVRVAAQPGLFRPAAAAALLAPLVRGVDLILLGRQSGLGGSRLTGRLLAARLDLPFIDGVCVLKKAPGGISFAANGDGLRSSGVLTAPAVVLVGDGGWLRIPTLKARLASAQRCAEVVAAESPQGIDTLPVELKRPPARGECRFLNGSPAQQAEALLRLLASGRSARTLTEKDPCVRPAYGGALLARFGQPLEALATRSPPGESWLRDYAAVPDEEQHGLAAAELVLIAGRGLRQSTDRERLERLARRLGAQTAATRAAILNGWYPVGLQAGVSGAMLRAGAAVVFGASGAPAFAAALRDCGLVIAVNSDSTAPIFSCADWGVAGDAGALLREIENTLDLKGIEETDHV